ncbi:MAG: hypothetical protein ACHQX4_08940 [Gemmatimonadales bacterium]
MIALLLAQLIAPPSTRIWHDDERALITDLTVVTAVAATRSVVYAAVPGALAVYDRAFRTWKETIGALDGFPRDQVTAMAANPEDDTAWLAGAGQWLEWSPFGRRLDSGPLPGYADAVVLDARDPSRGAYFHTGAGWYFVARGALAAEPARDVPAPNARLGGLSYAQLVARAPALDAVRFRFQRDEHLRDYRLTAAAVAPLTNEIYVATDGNGVFEVDPLTYATTPLPKGALGAAVGAVAVAREEICAASDARARSTRRGITCFDESLRDMRYIETAGLAGLPGTLTRRLLITQRAVWAATDQGLVRADRRSDRVQQIGEREGLPGLDAYALAPTPAGVWVGTSRGIALVADTGRAVTVVRSITSGPVLALLSAWDTLWAGTPAGLALLPPSGDALLLVDGPAPVRDPIVALARHADTLVAATATRFIVHAGEWRVVDVPGRPIGRITAMAADTAGLWVAGSEGFAFFDPSRALWNALVAPGDVPHPVRDVVASRDHVWIATEAGLVRYARRVLVP